MKISKVIMLAILAIVSVLAIKKMCNCNCDKGNCCKTTEQVATNAGKQEATNDSENNAKPAEQTEQTEQQPEAEKPVVSESEPVQPK